MRKLQGKFKVGLYACSGMGINMMNLMMGSYLCSALIAGGFGQDALPFQTYIGRDLVIAALWATFVLIAKIVDGVIDIPMAAFTDKFRSRFGRRRPSIVIGLVPLIISYLLFLVIPDPSGATLLNTVYYGLVLCLFYSAYTLTMTTYYATFTEIVDNESDRRRLGNVKAVCDIIYFILGYVVVRMLLNGINIRVVALITLPLALTMLIPLFMIKEPSNLDEAAVEYKTVGLVASLKHTMKNRSFVLWMIVHATMQFGVQLFLGGINEYFSFTGMSMIFVMVAAFAPVPLTFILYNRFVDRHGFGFGIRYTFIVFAVGMLGMFGVSFLPAGGAKTALAIVTGLISSFAIGAIFATAYTVPSQLAAEEEAKDGIGNSAMYFAVQGLFDGVATGVATGVVLTALKKGSENGGSAMIYLTLIAAAALLAATLLTTILPKSVLQIGKKERA
ncbi:MAG: MFS transporter [Oscillospiraceae bacterium]|nr:MFS transporter [Oscillospiraceae bacterium]